MRGPVACTIVATRGLARARAVAAAFLEHNPAWEFVVVVSDAGAASASEPPALAANEVSASICVAALELHHMAMMYDEAGLNAALKPYALRHLLDEGASIALYVAPDVHVLGPLDDYLAGVDDSGFGVPRRITRLLPDDGLRPGEIEAYQLGPFNTALVAASPAGTALLDWWAAHLRRDCVDEPAIGISLDQRWLDVVPGLFAITLLPETTLVSHWNLHESVLTRRGEGWWHDGTRVAAAHLEGFDPERPWLLSQGITSSPRLLISERPDLAALVDVVRAAWAGTEVDADAPYGWGTLDDGTPIDVRMRHAYREALTHADRDASLAPPRPFGPGTARTLLAWLQTPVEGQEVSRYLAQIWSERSDLRGAYPSLLGREGAGFVSWCATYGMAEAAIPAALVPDAEAPRGAEDEASAAGDDAHAWLRGINVAGYFRSVLGLGEAARLLVHALDTTDLPFALVTNEDDLNAKAFDVEAVPAHEAVYGTNLLCITADRTPAFARAVGHSFLDGRYSIGLWFWETDRFTAPMHDALRLVDEIWVTSAYGKRVFGDHGKPVVEIPLPVLAPAAAPLSRAELELPVDRFVFLFSFDYHSTERRKNPTGLIDAFRRAFAPNEGPVLVLKSINGPNRIDELEHVRMAAAGRGDILLLDGYVPEDHRGALLKTADCYVSLHRSEGFGLGLAESMALSVPVIATGYSGNLAFMDDETAYLVGCEEVEVGPGAAPYPPDGRWAEPDLDHAAEQMRRVVEHPEEAALKAKRAAERIATQFSPEVSGRAIRHRLAEIELLLADAEKGPSDPLP
jgi:glycosyltransferase involved in cell wall biosynthesis